jgi:hypothetical protein
VAQSNELRALVDFTKAKNNLDKAMGNTFDVYHICVEEANAGSIDPAPKTPTSVSEAGCGSGVECINRELGPRKVELEPKCQRTGVAIG